jgi:twitching motility protein PilT
VARIDSILRIVKERGASDLHLATGAPPILRLNGELAPVEQEPVAAEVLSALVREMMTPGDWTTFERVGEIDFGYEIPGVLRVRCNVFEQRRGISGAFRLLPTQVFTLEQLGLPASLTSLVEVGKGIVVVTGPPGSGKSSTQAALIDHLNRNYRRHIVTLEDPIEYVHENKLSLVNQREVGRHTKSFSAGLRAALREDPNMILVGEMRDLETIALAVTAAETGQFVLGTLHTASASQTVDRLIDVFEPARQEHIRTMLAESLRAVIAQRLLPRVDGKGRAVALEVLVGTTAVRSLIRERKTFQLPTVMQTGKRDGMVLMDDSLLALVQAGAVAAEEARRQAVRKELFAGVAEPRSRAA